MRALRLSLRGVRGPTLLLGGLIVAFASPVVLARPTHAEGLLPTVRCLVQTLLLSGCPQPVTVSPSSPQTPAEQPASQPQGGTVSEPSSSASSSAAPAPQAASSSTTQPAAPLQAVPSVETLDSPRDIKALPVTPTHPTQNPKSYDYVAFFNTSSPYAASQVKGDSTAFIQPTQEGWKVAGLAWYWWLTIIGAITGGAALVRRLIARRGAELSKL
jgi:hypothetical protein